VKNILAYIFDTKRSNYGRLLKIIMIVVTGVNKFFNEFDANDLDVDTRSFISEEFTRHSLH